MLISSLDTIYRKLDNVLLFPHIAGPTFDMREKVIFQLIKDVQDVQNGKKVSSEIPYDYAIRMTV